MSAGPAAAVFGTVAMVRSTGRIRAGSHKQFMGCCGLHCWFCHTGHIDYRTQIGVAAGTIPS